MFQGSIPQVAQEIVASIVSEWKCEDIWVGCSGNLTVERVVSELGFNVHGNDVTVYSCLLGRYFAGLPLNARYKESYEGELEFVKDYMYDDLGILVTAMLISGMSQYMKTKTNAYYEKMKKAYRDQWDRMYEETRDKIGSLDPFLSSFTSGDVLEYYKDIPFEDGFISFPPFYAGGYERMFKHISDVIEYEEPEYDILTPEKIKEWAKEVMQRPQYIIMLPERFEEFDDHLRGECVTSLHQKSMYIYANSEKSRLVMPKQRIKTSALPKIGEFEDIGNDIMLTRLDLSEFNQLRSVYLNRNIRTASASYAYAVVVDGKIVGVYAISTSPTLSNWGSYIDPPTVYLMSDFPVAPSKYKRLSKLIVMAVLSKEAKELFEKDNNRRVNGIVTTAFTRNKVSMKYRGLMDLFNRKEAEDQATGAKYAINYGQKCGLWTLDEALAEWKEKHGHLVEEE